MSESRSIKCTFEIPENLNGHRTVFFMSQDLNWSREQATGEQSDQGVPPQDDEVRSSHDAIRDPIRLPYQPLRPVPARVLSINASGVETDAFDRIDVDQEEQEDTRMQEIAAVLQPHQIEYLRSQGVQIRPETDRSVSSSLQHKEGPKSLHSKRKKPSQPNNDEDGSSDLSRKRTRISMTSIASNSHEEVEVVVPSHSDEEQNTLQQEPDVSTSRPLGSNEPPKIQIPGLGTNSPDKPRSAPVENRLGSGPSLTAENLRQIGSHRHPRNPRVDELRGTNPQPARRKTAPTRRAATRAAFDQLPPLKQAPARKNEPPKTAPQDIVPQQAAISKAPTQSRPAQTAYRISVALVESNVSNKRPKEKWELEHKCTLIRGLMDGKTMTQIHKESFPNRTFGAVKNKLQILRDTGHVSGNRKGIKIHEPDLATALGVQTVAYERKFTGQTSQESSQRRNIAEDIVVDNNGSNGTSEQSRGVAPSEPTPGLQLGTGRDSLFVPQNARHEEQMSDEELYGPEADR